MDVIHYVPVCLNALLFRYEMDLYTIYHTVGNASKAEQWKERAEKRKKTVDHYLWDETHQTYFDYNFLTKQRRFGFHGYNNQQSTEPTTLPR